MPNHIPARQNEDTIKSSSPIFSGLLIMEVKIEAVSRSKKRSPIVDAAPKAALSGVAQRFDSERSVKFGCTSRSGVHLYVSR